MRFALELKRVDGLTITARMLPPPAEGTLVQYIAAAAAERRSSFTGSCLPFMSEAQAFQNTPNQGEFRASGGDGTFKVTLETLPNAYYVGLGTVLIQPALHVRYYDAKGVEWRGGVQLPSLGFPYRTLTYPAQRSSVEFYRCPDRVARSQESILRASSYPLTFETASQKLHAIEASGDFWQGRPPC